MFDPRPHHSLESCRSIYYYLFVVVCCKCGENKGDAEFYRRRTGARTGQYYTYCKECYKKRGRLYYQNHKEKQRTLSNRRRIQYRLTRRALMTQLKNKPCADCGKCYPPYVMDFDHHEDECKLGSISNLVNRNFISLKSLREEIGKCDVVCANCHRMRTFARMKKEPEIE